MATIARSSPEAEISAPAPLTSGLRRERPEGVPESRYYTGMIVFLGGVTMLFAAFTSAYIVRKGISDDWSPMAVPALVWLNTLVLLISSLTVERARRYFDESEVFVKWWLATTVLGVCFLLGQLVVWGQLVGRGVYLSTNPSSAFFYIMTGAHGIHLMGGVLTLVYFSWRILLGHDLKRMAVNATALYWHFMDGLWVYLLMLLFLWR